MLWPFFCQNSKYKFPLYVQKPNLTTNLKSAQMSSIKTTDDFCQISKNHLPWLLLFSKDKYYYIGCVKLLFRRIDGYYQCLNILTV
jgi:hypothetical protein